MHTPACRPAARCDIKTGTLNKRDFSSRTLFGGSVSLRGPFDPNNLTGIRAQKWNAFDATSEATDHAWQVPRLQGLPVADGATFTPYANVTKCTAHCHYCSEDLKRHGQQTANSHPKHLIRDHDLYFSQLQECFGWLSAAGLRFGLSVSGLEATVDPTWLRKLLRVSNDHAELFTGRVLYTNGTGLYSQPELADGFDRVEIHRDHHDDRVNQQRMRLERRVAVLRNAAFAEAVRRVAPLTADQVFAVCILSRDGIHTLAHAQEYTRWARTVGFSGVIFRELSRLSELEFDLDGQDRAVRWVETNRVSIDELFRGCAEAGVQPERLSVGYYYYNEMYAGDIFCGEMTCRAGSASSASECLHLGGAPKSTSFTVTLEASCYEALRRQTARKAVNKLVFHSNGNLTSGWDRDSQVVADAKQWATLYHNRLRATAHGVTSNLNVHGGGLSIGQAEVRVD